MKLKEKLKEKIKQSKTKEFVKEHKWGILIGGLIGLDLILISRAAYLAGFSKGLDKEIKDLSEIEKSMSDLDKIFKNKLNR